MLSRIVLTLVAALFATTAFSESLSVDEIPTIHYPNDWSSLVLHADRNPDSATYVLEFIRQQDEKRHESEATISLNGVITKLIRTHYSSEQKYQNKKQPSLGRRFNYVFYSQDKSTKVLLTSRIVSSSCYANADSEEDPFCGDTYQGTLRVDKNGEHVVIPISYYRGF